VPVNDAFELMRAELEKTLKIDVKWGDDDDLTVSKLPMNLGQFDEILGGGFAFNRVTILMGLESAGKTLIGLHALKRAIEEGIPAVYIDVERSWDADWARKIGLNPSEVMVAQPPTGEKAFDVLNAIVATPGPGVVLFDSLAMVTADAEIEASAEQATIGIQARLINRSLRKAVTVNQGWAIIAINQIRESIGVTFGNPETMPGGKGQRYYAWQIIRVSRGAYIDDDTSGPRRTGRVGYMLRITLEKSKQSQPFQEAEIPFYFTNGQFDMLSPLVDMALKLGIISVRAGGNYTYGEVNIRGKKALFDYFKEVEERVVLLQAQVDAFSVSDL